MSNPENITASIPFREDQLTYLTPQDTLAIAWAMLEEAHTIGLAGLTKKHGDTLKGTRSRSVLKSDVAVLDSCPAADSDGGY